MVRAVHGKYCGSSLTHEQRDNVAKCLLPEDRHTFQRREFCTLSLADAGDSSGSEAKIMSRRVLKMCTVRTRLMLRKVITFVIRQLQLDCNCLRMRGAKASSEPWPVSEMMEAQKAAFEHEQLARCVLDPQPQSNGLHLRDQCALSGLTKKFGEIRVAGLLGNEPRHAPRHLNAQGLR